MSAAVQTRDRPMSHPGDTRPVTNTHLAGRYLAGQLAGWLVAAVAVALRDHGTAASLVVLVWLTLFPGDALRSALRVRAVDVHLRVLLAVSGSIFLVILSAMTSSVFVGTLLPAVRPLDALPLFVLLSGYLFACLATVAFSRTYADAAWPSAPQWVAWGILALLAELTWIGTEVLDAGKGPWLSVLALSVLGAAVVWGAVSRSRVVDTLRPAFVFFLTLAVSWSFSQRGDYLYGFDLHQEHLWAQRTLESGVWERVPGDPYAAMLSITALPVSIASLGGVELIDYFKTYAPLTFALYALGAFLFISRFATRTSAYVVTLLFVFVPQALWQLPAVSRQEVALLAFAVTMLLMFGAGGTGRGAKAFACCTAVLLATTHYTSAYVTVAVVVGGFLLSWLWRRVRPGWRNAPRHLPVAVVIALLVAALGWNVVYTQSSLNVGSAVDKSSQAGLRSQGGLIDTFLNGANIMPVPTPEYFAETQIDASQRDWLLPYSTGLQQQFVAEAQGQKLPEQFGPAGALAPVSVLGYMLLRQFSNLLMGAGVLLLAWRHLRRREPGEDDDLDVLSLAAVALVMTAATRFNAELSQAYNPERLLLQTAFFLGVGAAVLGSDLAAWFRRLPVIRSHPSRGHVLTRLALGTIAALLVFDATGIRALTISNDSGNLHPDGEYARRFGFTDADLAAAGWLGSRFDDDDMVFADSYGILLPQGMPAYTQGLFGEMSPYTLDQRAYVLATTENVRGGRGRAVKRSVRTTFVFPRTFLSTYKSRIYSNGSAEVYR